MKRNRIMGKLREPSQAHSEWCIYALFSWSVLLEYDPSRSWLGFWVNTLRNLSQIMLLPVLKISPLLTAIVGLPAFIEGISSFFSSKSIVFGFRTHFIVTKFTQAICHAICLTAMILLIPSISLLNLALIFLLTIITLSWLPRWL